MNADAAPCTIAPADVAAFRDGSHPRPFEVLGAHACAGREGVCFAVWAPRASAVRVVGSFNDWNGERHALRPVGHAGLWEGYVAEAREGDSYQFELVDAQGVPLPRKADPFARAAQMRPAVASRVAALPPRRSLPAERRQANRLDAPISIYEVHLGSWQRDAQGNFLDWDALIERLPGYVAGLGFTHVELLPITEHPFDGSWGYQTLGQYAPTARFGSPDGLARFVAACQAQGLGVLLDWVPGHFPLDAHGLATFDGAPLYEYADPREGFHREWQTLIYDFGSPQVQSFLAGSALYWVERFGVDGLRVDAVASMLYRDFGRPSGQWVPNADGGRENREAAALLARINATLQRECPGALTIAEDSSTYPGVCRPVDAGGLGFGGKWNLGWMHDTLGYLQVPPAQRSGHHGKMTFGLVYAFEEQFVLPLSHDEVVHGKRSVFGRMPGEGDERFANLRAYYGFMWGHPGKKLLFMGQEFAQPTEWNHDAELPWHLLDDPRHAGVQALVRDLNRLYRSQPALHRLDGERAGFDWLVADDAAHCVFAWVRRAQGDAPPVVVICNFAATAWPRYRVPLPTGLARWRIALDTGDRAYGGEGGCIGKTVLADGQGALIDLPALSTLFLVPA